MQRFIDKMNNINPKLTIGLTVFLLTLLSGFVTSGNYLREGTLYWDNARLFTQFRDNLHALNFFGEIAWWFPHQQFGSPGYYHSILGVPNCMSPIFVCIGTVVWLLGRLSIFIQEYHDLYVFYFGFLSTGLFLLSVWSLGSYFLKSYVSLIWVLIIAAFSPAVIMNSTDIGFLEPTAYGLFFCGCCLRFFSIPNRSRFLALLLSGICIGLSLNNGFLYAGLVLVSGTLFVCLPWFEGFSKLKTAISKFSFLEWFMGVLFIVVSTLPSFITLSQGRDLIRSTLGKEYYSYTELKAGNPLEFLSTSIPGNGYAWILSKPKQEISTWEPIKHQAELHSGFYYLGMLAFPLFLLALLMTPFRIRIRLIVLSILFYTVVPLSGHSPIFSLLLIWPTPLQGINHFSDMTFRLGTFLLLVFGAGIGLDTLLKNRKAFPLFYFLFMASAIISLAILWTRQESMDYYFGTYAALSVLLVTTFCFLQRFQKTKFYWAPSLLLLACSLIDNATYTSFFVRDRQESHSPSGQIQNNYVKIPEKWAPNNIGIEVARDPLFYTNGLLMYKDYLEMGQARYDMSKIPEMRLYSKAHLVKDFLSELPELKKRDWDYKDSVPLTEAALHDMYFRPFIENPKPSPYVGSIGLVSQTYSSMNLRTESATGAILFLRNGYSPYWSVWVNGLKQNPVRAFFNYQAIAVPAGVSSVEMKFSPPYVGKTLLLAYFIFAMVSFTAFSDLLSFDSWLVTLRTRFSRLNFDFLWAEI